MTKVTFKKLILHLLDQAVRNWALYHITDEVNNNCETVDEIVSLLALRRNEFTQEMSEIFYEHIKEYPDLQTAEEAKAELHAIYESQDIYEAHSRLVAWKHSIGNELIFHFKDFIETVDLFHDEILESIDFTGANNLIN